MLCWTRAGRRRASRLAGLWEKKRRSCCSGGGGEETVLKEKDSRTGTLMEHVLR